jgi:hypothetical protein
MDKLNIQVIHPIKKSDSKTILLVGPRIKEREIIENRWLRAPISLK